MAKGSFVSSDSLAKISWVWLGNAFWARTVTVLGITTDGIIVPSKAPRLISSTPSESVTDSSLAQPENVSLSMTVTFSGITILVRPHWAKADSPMAVRLFGSWTLSRFSKEENPWFPMAVTPSFTTSFFTSPEDETSYQPPLSGRSPVPSTVMVPSMVNSHPSLSS